MTEHCIKSVTGMVTINKYTMNLKLNISFRDNNLSAESFLDFDLLFDLLFDLFDLLFDLSLINT